MTDIQEKQLQILIEFIRVCKKHGLKYYLFGGSALGAVRHQGFIPWDDDVDVCMPRPDFDKLMKLADEFEEPYFYKIQKQTEDIRIRLQNSVILLRLMLKPCFQGII